MCAERFLLILSLVHYASNRSVGLSLSACEPSASSRRCSHQAALYLLVTEWMACSGCVTVWVALPG